MDIYGWTGKILSVNLSTAQISTIETMRYARDYIGGLGIAARLAWEELRSGVGPFDPDNLLMIMVGPLTGTLASGAGRVEVMGIAPQQHPAIFSRSGMGGHWGAELKYAGYDGIVIRGQAEKPVYLWIHDGEAELRDAKEIWGQGTYATTLALRASHGPKTRIVSCGPAGENLSRVAVLQTETGNAAGQGGYGAVMGSKRLKAIAVRGTGGVPIAQPDEFMELCLGASIEGQEPQELEEWRARAEQRTAAGYRTRKCGFCRTPCSHRLYQNMPGESTPGLFTSARHCWGFSGPLRAHIEARTLASDFGLNGWEVSYGIIPWLELCAQHGLIADIDGYPIPVPEKPIVYLRDTVPFPAPLLTRLLQRMAFREGELGAALSDGACYAADVLFGGRGQPLLDNIYPRHGGQTEHWGGHWGPGGNVYWPFWLAPLLQWCMDTRDPANDSTHQFTEHAQHYFAESGPLRGPFTLDKVRAVCAKVYGDPDVGDHHFAYDPPAAKTIPALWHSWRGMILDSLILCDYENTRVFSLESEDGAADTALMAKLYAAATGFPTSERELDQAGERIWTLLRALDVRNFGRDRAVDESTLGGFLYPGKDDSVTLDRARFLPLMDDYYTRAGWNPQNGWPTRSKLEQLGLADVADELERLGRLG
jgi:aldehyde:ferredoxin oxidoreductase